MQMYSVKVLMQSDIEDATDEKIWEERLFFIYARDEQDVKRKTRNLLPVDLYQNANGELVRHSLARIVDLFELVDYIPPSLHGKEIYSRYFITPPHWSTEQTIRHYALDC